MDQTLFLQIILPLLVLQLILLVTALVSLVKSEHINGPKWMWVLIILLVNIIGPVLFFIFGKKKG